MVYEPDQHDDAVTPDNIVRSQFGSPRSGTNGATGQRDTSSDVPETYRFDPHRPRRRRYVAEESAGAAPSPTPPAKPAADGPADTTEPPTSGWTVARPTFGKDAAGPSAMPRRPSRAERRRAAEGDPAADPSAEPQSTDEAAVQPQTAAPKPPFQPPPASSLSEPADGTQQYAADRKSDLRRIASFLRSTQDNTEADDEQPNRPRADERTSELPTVRPNPPRNDRPQLSAAPAADIDKPSDAVLDAVRQIPGVTGARFTDSDQKLALDIADDADGELVQARVSEVINSKLGLRAQPVSAAVGSIETDTGERLAPVSRAVLERIQVITSGFDSTVEVALALDGSRAVGRSSGPAVEWHTMRAAADATVDAVSVLLGKEAKVVVEHASIEAAGSVKVALVVVLLLTEGGAEQLAGAAPVTGDRRQAIVHATLSALNRRIEAMLA